MAENCNECSIAWVRGGEYAEVSAHNGSRLKGMIERMSANHPEDVKILARNKDGSIFAHIPIGYVKLRAPRNLTDEQRAKLVERGKNMARSKGIDYEKSSDFDLNEDDEGKLNE